ncbi:hypothetical protein GCM10027346_24170 [Hymenobacter seoulensis]
MGFIKDKYFPAFNDEHKELVSAYLHLQGFHLDRDGKEYVFEKGNYQSTQLAVLFVKACK